MPRGKAHSEIRGLTDIDTTQARQPLSRPRVWEAAFLGTLSKRANVTEACRAAGIQRATAYKRRAENESFAARWDQAISEASDALMEEAWRRAVDGVDRPVYQGGTQVGSVREYSDRLMEKLLEAHHPAFRRLQRVELTGANGGPVQHQTVQDLSDAELMAIAAAGGDD